MLTKDQATLRTQRGKWLACLDGRDVNSIHNQLIWMIWDAGIFRVINEARRIGSKEKRPPKLNGAVHELINKCFFSTQVLSIRRMVDGSPIEGARGVYSLKALIADIKKHSAFLTRENIFRVEKLPYNLERIEAKAKKYCLTREKMGARSYCVPAKLDTALSRMRHEDVDALSGVLHTARSPVDCVRAQILDQLVVRLDLATREVVAYSNKFIAHAAAPDSRAIVDPKSLKIALNHIWSAHREIAGVTKFVGVHILGGASNDFFAHPQYDLLEHIDAPWIGPEDVHLLQKVWDSYGREVEDWNFGMEEARKELGF